MKPLFLLLFFSFLSNFAIAQDTLLTKLVAKGNLNEELHFSNPLIIDNQIFVFSSMTSDSLKKNEFNLLILDTLGNIQLKKNILLKNKGAIYFDSRKSVLINEIGNFVIAGLINSNWILLEITRDGKVLKEIIGKQYYNPYAIYEFEKNYLIECVAWETSGDCGTPSINFYGVFVRKTGEIDAIINTSAGYRSGKDSTIIGFSNNYMQEINSLSGKFKLIKQKNTYNYAHKAEYLGNNQWFVVGTTTDSLRKLYGNAYYGVYDEDFNEIWSNHNKGKEHRIDNELFSIFQDSKHKAITVIEEAGFFIWGLSSKKLNIHYIKTDGTASWSRNDTLAHWGYSDEAFKNSWDSYGGFCFLPNGNICTFINSETLIFKDQKYYYSKGIRFAKFSVDGRNFAKLYWQNNNSTFIKSIESKGAKVYPNPFSQSTTIELEGEYNDLTFNVFDVNGRLLRSEKFNGNSLNFQRNGLDGGMYIYEILSENKALQKGKIVIF